MKKLPKFREIVLWLRGIPLFSRLFLGFYSLSVAVFLWRVKALGKNAIVSVYLRRGAGRSETLPGASDLDFFLVLEEMGVQEEMLFLKKFWDSFRWWKKYFPFWGETLMADRNEFANWFATPTVRSFEAKFSWKLLWGEQVLEDPKPPHPRDVFSEAAKCYWMLIKPMLREGRFPVYAHELGAVEFRNSAKAFIDILRLEKTRKGKDLEKIWAMTRGELLELPDFFHAKALRNFLFLQNPLPAAEESLQLFSSFVHEAYGILDSMAISLSAAEGEGREFSPLDFESRLGKDSYSFAVRELFAERMILRHKNLFRRVLVADETTHIFFPFHKNPTKQELCEVLRDLREAGTSFNGSSVAIPLSEITLRELERTSFLDSPFHSFLSQQEMELKEDGFVHSSPYHCRAHSLPLETLQKTFAEVSLALRFQPPPDFFYVVENLITLVLQLRVAEEDGKVPIRFHAAIQQFCVRHPLRGQYLKSAIGKYLNLNHEDENLFWEKVFGCLQELKGPQPGRAALLEAQLGEIRDRRYDADWKLQKATTDLWIEMTPFLRLEMNAMRERYLEKRSVFRL